MSITPYFNQSEIHNNLITDYGTTLKYIVQTLVSLDPMLSIYSVSVDTANIYDAYLRISDSKEGFRIHNNSSSYKDRIYMGTGYWDKAGKWVSQSTWQSQSYPLQPTGQVCCFAWGIGGCLRYFGVSSSYDSAFIGGHYGRFTYSGSEKSVLTRMSVGGTKQQFPSVPTVTSYVYRYMYNEESDVGEALNTSSFEPSSAYNNSGYGAALMPLWYQGYTTNRGFLNINWDGSHKLYQLYSGTSAVSLKPGQMVTINGVSIMSVGLVIFAV